MKTLYILTGPVGTGKTTKLQEWASFRDDVCGILQPVRSGMRYLYFLRDRSEYRLEIETPEEEFTPVGRYKFGKKVLALSREEIGRCFGKGKKWIIIDEYGKLEMSDSGLEPAVSNLILGRSEIKSTIIIVVRDYLLDQFLQKFGLKRGEYEVITKDQIDRIDFSLL